jgi:DNA polymerase-3 subunit epsilon
MTLSTQLDWLDAESAGQLSSGFPQHMVLLDCETTGGRATYHRIIEIGLLLIEEGTLVKSWQSFVDPQRPIPPGITRLTGITQSMVNGAPTFAELADELLELLADRTLVAHHARFDYGFLKQEFKRLGISYQDKPLCSVKLSRLLYPQFNRHGLDQIIRRFQLTINNRHRALDDAQMIHRFFLKTSQIHATADIEAACQQLLKEHSLPSQIRQSDVDALPKSPGVYHFYDARDVLLYVGKSVNIRQRVLSHFSQDHQNHKDLKMSASIASITHQQTVSDLGAQLLESQQVKSLKPLYNSRLRRVRKLYRLVIKRHPEGYDHPEIVAVDVDDTDHLVQNSYGLFRSRRQVHNKLHKLADHFMLCHQVLGIENQKVSNQKACFRHQLNKCQGVCCGQETYADHNERLARALKGYQQKIWPWPDAVLVEERSADEDRPSQFHLINQWVYLQGIDSEQQLREAGFEVSQQPSTQFPDDREQALEDSIDGFDLDIYFILVRFLLDPDKLRLNHIHVHPLIRTESE